MSPQIRRNDIARRVRQQLGRDANQDMIDSVVERVMALLPGNENPTRTPRLPRQQGNAVTNDRIIVSVFGMNRPGIVAGVTAVLAKHDCNILDISQKLMQELFTMILVVDMDDSNISFENLQQSFDHLGNELGIKIYAQHEDVFNAVNRL